MRTPDRDRAHNIDARPVGRLTLTSPVVRYGSGTQRGFIKSQLGTYRSIARGQWSRANRCDRVFRRHCLQS